MAQNWTEICSQRNLIYFHCVLTVVFNCEIQNSFLWSLVHPRMLLNLCADSENNWLPDTPQNMHTRTRSTLDQTYDRCLYTLMKLVQHINKTWILNIFYIQLFYNICIYTHVYCSSDVLF
jgi:hypothetical protein